jgi:hypothetical protein
MFVEMSSFQFFDLGEPCPETSWGRMLLIINGLMPKLTLKKQTSHAVAAKIASPSVLPRHSPHDCRPEYPSLPARCYFCPSSEHV